MTQPDVSVVIGAYEAMPYLVKCLESLEAQTLGPARIEVIAVDDGSTDGTGEYLEEFADRSALAVTVFRQANSGGPSGPRNVGLDKARGRYVFFLDADDHLGPEALERMVAMADEQGTDVVLGKVVGVDRAAPRGVWDKTLLRTDVFSSRIKFALSAQKLFRHDLLTRHAMHFDESLKTGEDALFTLEAYLHADGVSVLADYDCYYLVGRADGKQVTKSGSYTLRFDSARALMGLIAEHVPAGKRRDGLMVRPFLVTLLPQFGLVFLKDSEEVRRNKLALAKPLLDAHWTKGVASRLKVNERLRLHLAALGRADLLVDVLEFIKEKKAPTLHTDGRRRKAYLAYPHFRDREVGIPDSLFIPTSHERGTIDGLAFAPDAHFPGMRTARRVARKVLGARRTA